MRKDVDLLRMEKSVYASNEWPCIFTTPWALKNHNTIFFPAIGQTTTWQMGTNESFLGCWGIQMQPVSNSHPFHQTGHKGILISTNAECRCKLMPQQAKKKLSNSLQQPDKSKTNTEFPTTWTYAILFVYMYFTEPSTTIQDMFDFKSPLACKGLSIFYITRKYESTFTAIPFERTLNTTFNWLDIIRAYSYFINQCSQPTTCHK